MEKPPDPERVMTVGELRSLLEGLPNVAPIFVDGYEGGFSMPRLAFKRVKTLEPWVESYGFCGAWTEDETGSGPWVYVLERGG